MSYIQKCELIFLHHLSRSYSAAPLHFIASPNFRRAVFLQPLVAAVTHCQHQIHVSIS